MACALVLMAAQHTVARNTEKGQGKVILTTFANMYSGFGEQNDARGFELERAYIGYQYSFNNGLSMQAVADFGRSKEVQDMQRIGFIKNAWVRWQKNGWDLYGGLISTTQFKTQEDFWGKRYVMKSFQDEYKFGSSADVGMSVAYRFCDQVSADVIVVNGEGYKKVQVNDGLQYGAGVTFTPVKGLTLRAYASYNEGADDQAEGKLNCNVFAGYAHERFNIGAEYNYQTNSDNVKDQDQSGCSVYTTISLGRKVDLFGRWDYLTSKDDWNKADDGMAGVVGAEFKLGKYIKLAPNVRIWSPKADGVSNSYYAYLNCSFSI